MTAEENQQKQKFSFNYLPGRKFAFLKDGNVLELLMKWSMLGRISAQAFNFDQPFHPYRKNDFASDFFEDPHVLSNLKVIESSGLWKTFDRNVTNVNVEIIPCTKVSMDLFDGLYSHGILHPSGHIAKCFHEFYADFDELRKMLLIEDSDNFTLISLKDRQEFLFRLFKHICLGGELCQYEDVIGPYIETTKSIYKDIVSVQKDPETKEISVISTVLKVAAFDHSGLCYPSTREEEQTFAYLIIDPLKRHVYVLYHSFGVGSFSKPEN